MAITSPRMGLGNRTYPYKRKLKPGTPPAKAKYGIEIMQDGGPTTGRRRRNVANNVTEPVESSSVNPATLPFNPYNLGLRPSYTPAKSDIQTQTPTMPVNAVDTDVLAFTQAYAESPKYRERLSNFYKYPDYIQRQRVQKLGNVGFTESSGNSTTAYSDTSAYPNQLNVDTNQLTRIRAGRAEAVAHELGHATNANEANPALRLNAPEENFILNRNRTITPEERARYRSSASSPTRDNPNATLSGYLGQGELHDIAPSETMSDVQALRYQMNKAGIYDARTQDLTPEVLQKALTNPQIKNNFSTKRLLENFKQNDLLDILNKVALNQQPGTASNVAKMGGKIRRMQEGGDLPKYVTPNRKVLQNPSFTNEELSRLYNPDEAVRNWYVDYINSPKYKERLRKQGYTNANQVVKDRRDRIQNTKIVPVTPDRDGSYYDTSSDNTLYMDNRQVKRLKTTRDDVLAHELSHVNNSSINSILTRPDYNVIESPSNTSLSAGEEEYIGSRNKKVGALGMLTVQEAGRKQNKTASNILTNVDHDASPYESKSDLDAFRYILQQEGIYDSGTQDFTPELLEKAKKNKNIKKAFTSKRLFDNFSDENIIDIMNNVAYNNENNNPMIAKKGGLSRAEDYGSKKKPYPSVSKGDFAGGGRSYPIPTKADAIDALRLAGLHGRADVKAKVYAKYPELKKELGGEVFAHDANKVQNIWYPKLKADLGVEVPEGYHLMSDGTVMADDVMLPEAKKGIYIKPENRGKFTATKKRTGKTTEELTHSKNPKTRKRAIFAQNAAKWRKGKYGLEIYDAGGLIDPNDPMFAQQIQDLIRNNPELAQEIFTPSVDSTPPGAGQEITGLQQASGAPTMSGPANVDTNTNAQNNKPRSNKPKVNFPSINVGDAISMGVQGLDLLATEYIDAPRKRANEMRLLRQQLAPVISRPSTGGYDMPVLAKSGIQITSAYTDPVGLPSPTKAKNPFGNVGNRFKVDDPEFANVLAEGGEFLELPDGQTSTITGDKHSDYSGGEFMSLPEGAKIYSDSIKVDKRFQKDLTGSNSGKKKTVAQIAKKFDTEHEEGILKDPTADNISKRSANIMKTFKQSQLQQLFDYQESVKDPMYMINKDQSANDYLGSEDTVVAKKGVKVMQEGGQPPKRRRPIGVFPNRDALNMYTISNGQPVLTAGQVPDTEVQIDQTLPNGQPWWNNIGGTNNNAPQPVSDPYWWMRDRTVQGVPPPVNIQGQMAMLKQPTSTPKYTTPDSTPDSTPTPGINTVGTTLDPVSGVRAPEIQVAVPPVTIPIGEPIDPNKSRKPMPDNNKVNPPAPNPKVPWSNTLNSFGEIVPELAAYIQNETDFPVFTARYQPRYLNPVELNIQASLNRNYAQTAPLLEGSSGNPSVDNARAAQALANLYDANNEAFQQKFNFDTQNRYQTDATNLQIENQANLYNLQRADDYWNKITARQAVKEATRNNIMNSAYSKFKRKQLEDRSLQLTNQMFDNFRYDPQQGIYFTPNGEQYIFHEPSGNFINIGTTPGDGVETTRTVRNTPKGTTTTLRQKEKKGS